MGCTSHLFQQMTTRTACPACLQSQTSGSVCPSCRIPLVSYYVEPDATARRQPVGEHLDRFRTAVEAYLAGRSGVEDLDAQLLDLRVRFDHFQTEHAAPLLRQLPLAEAELGPRFVGQLTEQVHQGVELYAAGLDLADSSLESADLKEALQRLEQAEGILRASRELACEALDPIYM